MALSFCVGAKKSFAAFHDVEHRARIVNRPAYKITPYPMKICKELGIRRSEDLGDATLASE